MYFRDGILVAEGLEPHIKISFFCSGMNTCQLRVWSSGMSSTSCILSWESNLTVSGAVNCRYNGRHSMPFSSLYPTTVLTPADRYIAGKQIENYEKCDRIGALAHSKGFSTKKWDRHPLRTTTSLKFIKEASQVLLGTPRIYSSSDPQPPNPPWPLHRSRCRRPGRG